MGKGAIMTRKLFGMAALAALGACSMSQDTATAEAAVARFHQMLDAGQFHEIYAATDSAFRSATPEAELTQVLQVVHDRLGAVREANRQGWHVNYSNGVTSVELNYNTTFVTAPGTEHFVYRINNGAATLVRYDVNSDALRTAGATADTEGGQGDTGQGDTGGK